MSYTVIIPCAGVGARVGLEIPKQYIKIRGKTILEHTLGVFINHPKIDKIIINVAPDDSYAKDYAILSSKIEVLDQGGDTRAQTVLNALQQQKLKDDDWVLIHDAVRCCLRHKDLDSLIEDLQMHSVGGVLAVAATDTIKLVDRDNMCIKETLNRKNIYLVQTPQMFRYGILCQALKSSDLQTITDDASAVENSGYRVKIVEGDKSNIKITTKADLELATYYLTKDKNA